MSITRQVIGSFESIGKDVAKQTASVPKDIAGKALESLGVSGGQKTGQTANQIKLAEEKAGPMTELDQTEDKQARRAIARRALEYLAAKRPTEPGVRERLEKEEEKKREAQKQQDTFIKKTVLRPTPSARPKGDLFGLKAKKNSAEMSRNVRQD